MGSHSYQQSPIEQAESRAFWRGVAVGAGVVLAFVAAVWRAVL